MAPEEEVFTTAPSLGITQINSDSSTMSLLLGSHNPVPSLPLPECVCAFEGVDSVVTELVVDCIS